MKIGSLTELPNAEKREFHGQISTLNMDLSIKLVEAVTDSPNAPNFNVFAKNENGKECEIGAAWRKVPTRHTQGFDEFLSLTLDDPSFSHSLNVVAFPKENDQWDITWRRRQANQAETA